MYWLICAVKAEDSEIQEGYPVLNFKLYRVSTKEPKELSVPENTLLYTIAENTFSEKEMYEQLMVIKVGMGVIAPKIFIEQRKIYAIGKEVIFDGIRWCLNENVGTLMPLLLDSMEVIEP